MANTLFPDIEDDNILPDAEPINDATDITELPADMPERPQESSGDYEFKTGNINDFMASFQEEKEDMPIDERPTPEEFAEAGKQTLPPATARKTGKFFANMVDHSCAIGLSLLSGEPAAKHRAPEDSKKELESIITEYLKESGGEIPLSAQLIICLVVTYGLQIPGAYKKYKERKAHEIPLPEE